MEEELIITYNENNQANDILNEMISKHYLFVKHSLRTKQLFFKKPQKEPETIITEK